MTVDTLIFDNGGSTIKAGLANLKEPQIFPNCVSKAKSERRRLFVSDQLDECKDCSGLFVLLPLSRGVVTNYDTQRQIWDHVIRNRLQLKDRTERTVNVIVTQPHFNFRQSQVNLYELFFEEYLFDNLFTATPTCFAALNQNKNDQNPLAFTGVIVDSGFSSTHVVPYVNGTRIKNAIVRIEVGGKALTNHLKDLISYRQLHVLDETHVMNQCKEDCCFVSTNLNADLAACKRKPNSIAVDYVLPDYVNLRRGYKCAPGSASTKEDPNLQTIRLNNERFQVPELLFFPSDIGLQQIGLSHSIYYAVEKVPEEYRPDLYRNIVLIGGNCNLPGIKERVQQDLRSLAESAFEVCVHLPDKPEQQAWLGGQRLINDFGDVYNQMSISRAEYQESGFNACAARFDI